MKRDKDVDRLRHPVWTVYDRLRTVRLNVKYYSRRLRTFERWNLFFDFVLLATAPSSAIAGLWFWDTDIGRYIWQYMGAIAAVVAVLKPLLFLPKRIKEYEGILSGYRVLEHDLRALKGLIEQRGKYDRALQNEFQKAVDRERVLAGKNPETHENDKIRQICEREVLQELPPESFYVPQES